MYYRVGNCQFNICPRWWIEGHAVHGSKWHCCAWRQHRLCCAQGMSKLVTLTRIQAKPFLIDAGADMVHLQCAVCLISCFGCFHLKVHPISWWVPPISYQGNDDVWEFQEKQDIWHIREKRDSWEIWEKRNISMFTPGRWIRNVIGEECVLPSWTSLPAALDEIQDEKRRRLADSM